jgi:hypothetical protein
MIDDTLEVHRLRLQLRAMLDGLEIPNPEFWMASQPWVLRAVCETIAGQAKRAADTSSGSQS